MKNKNYFIIFKYFQKGKYKIKKLLSILAAVGLTATTASSVVACDKKQENDENNLIINSQKLYKKIDYLLQKILQQQKEKEDNNKILKLIEDTKQFQQELMKNKNEIKTQIEKPDFINESNEKKEIIKNLLQENDNIQKKSDKLMLDAINLRVKIFFKEINIINFYDASLYNIVSNNNKDYELSLNNENDKKIYDLIFNTFANKLRKLNEEIANLFANYYLNEEYNFLPISFNKNDIKILLKNDNNIETKRLLKTTVELKIKYEIKFKKLTINNDDSLRFNITKK